MKIIKFDNIDNLSKYIKKIYQEYTIPNKKNNIIITGGSSKEILLKGAFLLYVFSPNAQLFKKIDLSLLNFFWSTL